MLVELLISSAVVLYLWMFVFKSKAQKQYSKFPGPKPYPVIGNILEFNHNKEEITETLKKLSYKYGPIFHLALGLDHIICVRDPSLIETLFSNSNALLDQASMYDVVKPFLEDGLFTCKAEKWKKQRKLLNPAFHLQVLETYIPIIERHSSILTANLLKHTGKDVDISKLVAVWTDDFLREAVMGDKMGTEEEENEKRDLDYFDLVHELTDIIVNRGFSLLQSSLLFHYLPAGRRHDAIIKYINDMIDKKIKERKQEYSAKKQESNINGIKSSNELGIKKKKTFLDLMLEYNMAGAEISDNQLRAEIKTFVIGGYDTTSSASSFLLYCLSQNPQVQERVYAEVIDTTRGERRSLTLQDLQGMKYLDRVMKEAQRLYPTAQFFARRNNTDLDLENGLVIPKDSTVMVLTEAMGHDPNIFPDPFKFDPDRFDGGNVHPFSHLPFGIAPRNCIGQKLATFAMKCLVVHVLRDAKLLPSNIPLKLHFTSVLTSTTGLHVRVRPRRD